FATMIDNLKYEYNGNKLTKVTDEQQNPSGYPYITTPNTITYDANGNMSTHLDKGISSIQYNYLNLPSQITQNSKVTSYTYRADGVKVKKFFGDIETNYLDGFQYKSTKPSEATPPGGFTPEPDPNEVAEMKLRIIPTPEGYYDVLSNQYIYNFTDHLGNVRLSYTDTNKDGIIQPRQYKVLQCTGSGWSQMCIDYWKPGEIVENNNYYPFGMLHNYTATTQNAYQYKFNGKELQENGMYDYGARMYMPDIGRWGVVDPLAEKMTRHSPYN
ncbi:RHS repeat domain-containing protein, partial [Chryseobacterium sp. Alg-005]|uniref:RHS repeat domain-containing protein n=1 Tax=Chryseobacterium sp. Alg-005 TaxID=3159516 RepID=UPI0036F34035